MIYEYGGGIGIGIGNETIYSNVQQSFSDSSDLSSHIYRHGGYVIVHHHVLINSLQTCGVGHANLVSENLEVRNFM